MNKPVLSHYHSVFLFLQDHYAYRKHQDATFSYEVWAQELGHKSRSYLRLVVMGQRPISESLEADFTKYVVRFNYSAEYFSLLVSYSQSKTAQQRELFGKKIMGLQKTSNETVEINQHYDFLANPLLPKLQTLMTFEDSPQTVEEIATRLQAEVSEIDSALAVLESMGLLAKDGCGQWKPLKKSWKVPENFKQLGHFEFYRNTFNDAEKAMNLPSEIRRFRSLFVAMNEEEFKDFLKDLESFVNLQLHKRDPAKLEDRLLYQLNFNCFPA